MWRWKGYPRLSVCSSVGAACSLLHTHKYTFTHTHTHSSTSTFVHQCTHHKCVKWGYYCHIAGRLAAPRPYNSPSARAPGAAVLSVRSSGNLRSANFPRLQTFPHLDVTPGSRCSGFPERRSGIIKPSIGEMGWQTAGVGDGFMWEVRKHGGKSSQQASVYTAVSPPSTFCSVISLLYTNTKPTLHSWTRLKNFLCHTVPRASSAWSLMTVGAL